MNKQNMNGNVRKMNRIKNYRNKEKLANGNNRDRNRSYNISLCPSLSNQVSVFNNENEPNEPCSNANDRLQTESI